jgi:hypothetical protein
MPSQSTLRCQAKALCDAKPKYSAMPSESTLRCQVKVLSQNCHKTVTKDSQYFSKNPAILFSPASNIASGPQERVNHAKATQCTIAVTKVPDRQASGFVKLLKKRISPIQVTLTISFDKINENGTLSGATIVAAKGVKGVSAAPSAGRRVHMGKADTLEGVKVLGDMARRGPRQP